jgi:hypothetical protein
MLELECLLAIIVIAFFVCVSLYGLYALCVVFDWDRLSDIISKITIVLGCVIAIVIAVLMIILIVNLAEW